MYTLVAQKKAYFWMFLMKNSLFGLQIKIRAKKFILVRKLKLCANHIVREFSFPSSN